MNVLKYFLIFFLTIALIGTTGYLLASSGIKSKPGYVKLTTPHWFSTDTIVAINLGPKGLKPVRWIINHALNSEGELEPSERMILSVLQDLQGMQLRVYEVENNRQIFEQAINDSVKTLTANDWHTILQVREDNNRVVVMQTANEGVIEGFSVLASSPENAVFLNLIGQINPESIALLADSLN